MGPGSVNVRNDSSSPPPRRARLRKPAKFFGKVLSESWFGVAFFGVMDRIGSVRGRIGEMSWPQRAVTAAPFVLVGLLVMAWARPDREDVFAQPQSVGRERQTGGDVTVSTVEVLPGVVIVPTTRPDARVVPSSVASKSPARYGVDGDPSTRAAPPSGFVAKPDTPVPTGVAAVSGSRSGGEATVTVPGLPGVTVLDVDARAHGMSPELHDQVLKLGVDVIQSLITGVGRSRFAAYFGGVDADGDRLAPPPVQCLAPEVTNSGLYATKYPNYGVVIVAWTCPGLEQEHVSEQLLFFTGSLWKPVHAWGAPADVTAGVMTG
jgi:hypothetical protein